MSQNIHTRRRLPFGIAVFALAAASLALPGPAEAKKIVLRFGDNSSEYARDGECDDPRFFGRGMAEALNDENIGHDAADCKHHYDMGTVKLWIESLARAATSCNRINYGDNTSEYARDGECDDPRFIGSGVDSIVLNDDIGHDATDCRLACTSGTALLRNY